MPHRNRLPPERILTYKPGVGSGIEELTARTCDAPYGIL